MTRLSKEYITWGKLLYTPTAVKSGGGVDRLQPGKPEMTYTSQIGLPDAPTGHEHVPHPTLTMVSAPELKHALP